MFKTFPSQAALALALATAPVAVLAAPWATEPAGPLSHGPQQLRRRGRGAAPDHGGRADARRHVVS